MNTNERLSDDVLLPTDPMQFIALCWPEMQLSQKQCDVIMSVESNLETFVHAANKTGKTRVAALIAIHFFFSRTPARVIISSSSEDQLRRTLWSEMVHLVNSSAVPLPFLVQDLLIKKLRLPGSSETHPRDYINGCVTKAVESFQGHHLDSSEGPRVLVIFDEASSIADGFYEASESWAHRTLVIGNPLSDDNFFYRLCQDGDVKDPVGRLPLMRKFIHVDGLDSPNVQLGMQMAKLGCQDTPSIVIPGLLTYEEYRRLERQWDDVKRTTRLHGLFYKGEHTRLFPVEWLKAAMDRKRWEERQDENREAWAMGVDVASGGRDNTVWTIIDREGLIEQIVEDTPNAMHIAGTTIELLHRYNLAAEAVAIDAGGGGKQIADRLAEEGHCVQVVEFGGAARDKAAYLNRRAELYGRLREMFDPDRDGGVFALPPDAHQLCHELSVIPRIFDGEGRLKLPPKNPTSGSAQHGKSLRQILGRSPDRADSLVLALWAHQNPPGPPIIDRELIVWPLPEGEELGPAADDEERRRWPRWLREL